MFFRILTSFCKESSIHGFKYLTEKRARIISKIFWVVAIISSIACTSILIKSLVVEYARNSVVITRDNEAVEVTEIPFPAFTICLPVKTGIDEPFDDLFYEGKFDYLQHVGNFFAIRGLWLEKYRFYMTYVVTKFGYCQTFNIMKPEEFFNFSEVDEIFNNPPYYMIHYNVVAGSPGAVLWNVTEPFKTTHKDLGVFIAIEETSKALGAQPSRQEFHLILHAPHEMPSEFSQQFIVSDLDILLFRITPQLTKIDESLIGWKPEERQCYLEGEKVLKMFKVYSFENCRSECLAEFIARRCACIPFYMIRNSSASICKSSQVACYEEAQEIFLQHEDLDCHCYPPCTQLKYTFDKEKSGLTEATTWYNYFKATFTSFSIRFKAGEFYPQVKRKQYTIVDIFAFVGGVLGLFFGMSVLSVVEIFYLVLVRPFTRATGTLPDQSNSGSHQPTKYFLSYLSSSSIHSLNHIGDGNRNFLERVAWVAIFVLSLIGCTFMIGKLQQKVKINSITMIIEDKSHENWEIPFPAITFFGTYPNAVNVCFYSEDGEPKNTTVVEQMKETKNLIQLIADSIVDSFQTSAYKAVFQDEKIGNTSQLEGYESQIVSAIHRRSKFEWFRSQNGSFCKHFGVPTAESLTSRGFGFAFNIFEADELYHEDQISKDFKYERNDDVLPNLSAQFPWSTTPGCAEGLEMNLNIKAVKNRDQVVFYSEAFFIHHPDDLPLYMALEDAYEVEPGKLYEVLITPEVITIDEDLKALPYEDRSCYVEGEKQLRFFKGYTRHNCEVECLSNRSIEACGCVPFDVIRDAETKVCGVDKANCINEVKYQLKFSSDNDDKNESCQCLLPCDSVVYSYKVVETKLRETRTSEALLTFKFKDSEYTSMKRVRQFTMVDFCSYFGGLLGLFAGFSVLSFCEIFYFFTLRLFSNLMLARKRPTHKIIQVRPRASQSGDIFQNGKSSNEGASTQSSTSLIEWTNDIHARPHSDNFSVGFA